MSLPEQASPEWAELTDRVFRKNGRLIEQLNKLGVVIMGAAIIIVYDGVTKEKFATEIETTKVDDEQIRVGYKAPYNLSLKNHPQSVADQLMSVRPGVPIICDSKIKDDLLKNRFAVVTGTYCLRMKGQGGTIEIYTPEQPKFEYPHPKDFLRSAG